MSSRLSFPKTLNLFSSRKYAPVPPARNIISSVLIKLYTEVLLRLLSLILFVFCGLSKCYFFISNISTQYFFFINIRIFYDEVFKDKDLPVRCIFSHIKLQQLVDGLVFSNHYGFQADIFPDKMLEFIR